MKALVYQGEGKVQWTDKPKPEIQDPTDAIVKIKYTTICGTDLHILGGDVPTCAPGRTLGHEGVGVVDSVGDGVKQFKVGDKVLISAISSCSACRYCKKGMFGQCNKGAGWLLGHTNDGCQAEYVRIAFADGSLHHTPEGVDEKALVMLSDILPTGMECGVINGKVAPGCTVAIVGAGPVGLACVLTSKLHTPSKIIVLDRDENRLEIARKIGAHHTIVVEGDDDNIVKQLMDLTGGIGADVVMEAVGYPATLEMCQDLVAPGGTIANIGVHGKSCILKIEKLWGKSISLTTRLVDTAITPMLLQLFASGDLNPKPLITHEFASTDMEKAYSTFKAAPQHSALKLLVEM